jgi:hypothetical protein
MAPCDLLATASSQGGDAPAWSWYVPLALVAVLIAALLAYLYFIKTLMPLVHVLYGLAVGAVTVGVMIGEPQSMEIVRSRGDRGPNTFEEFMAMVVVGTVIMLIQEARRRGRRGEGAGSDGAGGGGCGDEGGDDGDDGD